MKECKFCDAMRSSLQADAVSDAWITDAELYHEYSVAIVRRTWTKAGGKRNAGRVTDYRYKGCGYKLNYCPECGRKLKEK